MVTSDATARRRRVAWAMLGVLAVGLTMAVLLSLRSPPQMGASEEVFHTVDALYTAVRNRDDKQLAACEARLRGQRDAGQLPADSAAHLDGIIARARGGGWQAAAERLYDFMLAQRRDGIDDSPRPHVHKHPKAKGK